MLNDDAIALTNIHTVKVLHKRKINLNIVILVTSVILILKKLYDDKKSAQIISAHINFIIFIFVILIIISNFTNTGILLLVDADNKIVKKKSYIVVFASVLNRMVSIIAISTLLHTYLINDVCSR